MSKWFFKRGNARLSWKTLPEWVKWVAVSHSGRAFGFDVRPEISSSMHAWSCSIDDTSELLAVVGEFCHDWLDLLFERPAKKSVVMHTEVKWSDLFPNCSTSFRVETPCKPTLPTITAEEWAAIRLLLPGAEYVGKDRGTNEVFAFNKHPNVYEGCFWWHSQSPKMSIPILEDRFASIPWRDSLVKYEPPIEKPYIVIEHSDTKRKIAGPFSVCGGYKYLRSIAKQILVKTTECGYGWVQIDGGSKSIPNTPPEGWD